MDIQQIIKKFALMADLTLEETVPWVSLCREAMEEIQSYIREGVDQESNSGRLDTATASLVFYRYTLYRASGGGMESFSVGDIKINSNKKSDVENAYRIWRDAKASVADLLQDNDFVFEGIYEG